MTNKTLTRQCISCRKQFSRSGLIRLTKIHNNKSDVDKVVINPTKYLFGRSAYVCSSNDCIHVAIKQKKFEKMLKVSAKTLEKVIAELEMLANNNKNKYVGVGT